MTLWADELAAVEAAWEAAVRFDRDRIDEKVATWGDAVDVLADEEAQIRSAGRWTSGPSELMAVLGVQRNEVLNCRVLRWLLDPEGGHGLGARILRRLIGRLPIHPPTDRALSLATVDVEQGRSFERTGSAAPTLVMTRADVVIRFASETLVIEAKTFAPEGESQCRNLEDAWGSDPYLAFLTRSGERPSTAGQIQRWSTLRWEDVADDLDSALTETAASPPAGGRPAAIEYLKSLRRYLT